MIADEQSALANGSFNGLITPETPTVLATFSPADTALYTITKIQPAPEARRGRAVSHKNVRSLLPAAAITVLTEFISTGLLVLLGCMGCVPVGGVAPSMFQSVLAFGLVVMFLVQIFGHVSGCHMNPAVTLAAVLFGLTPPLIGAFYVLAQCAGAIAGFGVLTLFIPERASSSSAEGFCNTVPHDDISPFQGLMIELIITYILISVCCSFWDSVNKHKTDSLAIKFGLTISGVSFGTAPFTGASMNPARSLGPAVWNNVWRSHWIYWVAPLGAAVLASMSYKLLFLTKPQEDAIDLAEEVPLSNQEKKAGGAA